MTLQDRVSENVRTLTRARGMTTSGLARAIGIRSQRISQKLHGKVRWNIDDIETLADALEVAPGDLVSDGWSLELVRRPRQDSNLQPTDQRSEYGLAA